MRDYLKEHKLKPGLITAILGLIIFLLYAYLSIVTSPVDSIHGNRILNSPDETSTYFFIDNFAKTGSVVVAEPLNKLAGNVIHVRGMLVKSDGSLAPGSFLGIILFYGSLASVFGLGIVPYLTPLLAVFGLGFFYFVLKHLWGRKIAAISTILLALHPSWLLYSSRSMFHSVPFLSFLFAGSYFLLRYVKEKNSSFLLGAGLFIGLSAVTRTAEVTWMVPVLIILLFTLRKEYSFKHLSIFIASVSLPILLIFWVNNLTYGAALSSGYGQILSDPGGSLNTTGSISIFSRLYDLILPFGFHPRLALNNFVSFYSNLFWWLSWPALLGGILLIWNIFKKGNVAHSKKWYLLIVFIIGLVQVATYGSYYIDDILQPGAVSLSVSYVRYWLPLYAVTLPLTTWGILFLVSKISLAKLKIFITSIILIAVSFLSFRLAFWSDRDSILQVAKSINQSYQKQESVQGIVESEAVIVTERNDKVFFPNFSVIPGFLRDQNAPGVANLINQVPLYYYTFLNDQDVDLLSSQRLLQERVSLIEPIVISGQERLFKIVSITDSK